MAILWPSIGGSQFIRLDGPAVLAAAMEVEEITRPQVDGEAYRQLGKRGEVVTMVSEVDTNTPETLIDTYRAFKGTLQPVVLTDGTSGKTINNVMVRGVKRVRAKKVLTPVGGVNVGSWMLTVEWTLQAAS